MAKNKDKFVTENASIDFPQDDRTPWFRCDYGTYMNRAEYIDSFFDHPFINPLLYQDQLDELKSVDLYCCVGNDDCALDSSIELARIWKGNNLLLTREKIDSILIAFFFNSLQLILCENLNFESHPNRQDLPYGV